MRSLLPNMDRRWTGVAVMTLLATLWAGCDALTPEPPTVTYVATGSAPEIAVTYTRSNGTTTDEQFVTPPFEREIEGTWGSTVVFTVQTIEGVGDPTDKIVGKIFVNGDECVTESNFGGGLSVQCRPERQDN
jgi:hypothetical protein